MKVFEDHEHDRFRVIDRNGEPWFILNEVCAKLGIANPSDAASRLDADEKSALGIADPHGRVQRTTIISESGLYSVIIRSRVPKAKAFQKWVTSEVLPSIRKTGSYGAKVPAFIRRYNENWDRVDAGHFSVLNELVVHLWGRLENAGRIMADKAPDGKENRPDVSVGRCFSDWLKENHPTVSTAFSYYIHKTPEWEGEVRQYPFSVLPLFREYLDTVWIPTRAPDYLRSRDPAALPYLQKLLPSAGKPKIGMMRPPAKKAFGR
ncbi:BRO-N domain-containing protein [Mesorhizobium sp. CN2-181]|uniref:BRO-N domain-containing protein n=1 Tax=Mesorhizobium yinganensis TaxID=3157707 RepID=UPI0032B70101